MTFRFWTFEKMIFARSDAHCKVCARARNYILSFFTSFWLLKNSIYC